MWPNPQFPADLVTFTDEILNGKLRFLCSENLIITKADKKMRGMREWESREDSRRKHDKEFKTKKNQKIL